jgi:hypothetical protein
MLFVVKVVAKIKCKKLNFDGQKMARIEVG